MRGVDIEPSAIFGIDPVAVFAATRKFQGVEAVLIENRYDKITIIRNRVDRYDRAPHGHNWGFWRQISIDIAQEAALVGSLIHSNQRESRLAALRKSRDISVESEMVRT